MSTTFLCIVFCQTNNITDSNVMTFLGFPWLYLFEAVQDHSLCATCRSGSSPMVSHPGQDRSHGKIGTPAVLSCKKSSASSRSLTELDSVRSRLFLERHTWVRLDLQMVSACLFSQCQTFQDLVSISSCLVFVDLRKNLKLKLSSSLQGFPMVLSIASSWYWFTRLQKSYSTIHFDWIVFICVCKWCPKDEKLDIGCHDFSPLDQCVSSKSLPVCPATWQQPKKDSEAVLIT